MQSLMREEPKKVGLKKKMNNMNKYQTFIITYLKIFYNNK